MYDCFFPQCTASPGASPLRRRTDREVRRESCCTRSSLSLVLNRLDSAYDIEELIERIGHETVAENLNNAVINSADKKLPSSEGIEFIWTVHCQAMTQKSLRKADTNWTDQDSEDRKCFSCVIMRLGDHVIDVECAKQDVSSLSAIQSESDHWRSAHNSHQLPGQRPHREMHDEDENDDRGSLG